MAYQSEFFPSLEDISKYNNHEQVHQEMEMIVSHVNLGSFSNLDVGVAPFTEENNCERRQHDIGAENQNHSPQKHQDASKSNNFVATTKETIITPVKEKKKRMGCVCKKTGCLKLYCECFSNGRLCGEECSCCNCFNIVQKQSQIQCAWLTRKNRSSIKNGKMKCNCKKSHCQKKYCECYNSGNVCGQDCNCNGCQNHDPSIFNPQSQMGKNDK